MIQLVFIILLYWYQYSSILVQSHFEVISGEDDTKTSMDYDSMQEYSEPRLNKSKISKYNRHMLPYGFRSSYPPSATYILWLENKKQFPRWVYDMARSKYHDDNVEWRINELSKLYRKCDIITDGFPLSGIYIKHLLELIDLQKRIDDHSIIQAINTKEDLDYLRSVHLPKGNNLTIRLHLRDEDELLKKVDPIGYLKALVVRSPSVRNILNRKYLSVFHNTSVRDKKTVRDIFKQSNRSTNQKERRKKRLIYKEINTSESKSARNYKKGNKLQNIIDLIEDHGVNTSKSLRKELQHFNNYLEKTNVLKTNLKEKQLHDGNKFKKLSNTNLGHAFKKQETEDKEYKNKEISNFFSDYYYVKNKPNIKQSILELMNCINNGNIMHSGIKLWNKFGGEKKKKNKFNKVNEFIENPKTYKKIKKELSDNYLLTKYDLTDALENIGFKIPNQSKTYLIHLYGELLKNKQKAKLKELFDEQNFNICLPDMKYEQVIDMLASLMLYNVNKRRKMNRPKLAQVLEILGFNMTKSAKKEINKLYLTKMKSNSKFRK